MKFSLILILIICIDSSEINSGENSCHNYKPDKTIVECIGKETRMKHYGCCGMNLTIPNSGSEIYCQEVPNTKAAKDIYLKVQEKIAEKSQATLDLKCSPINDEIVGTCSDFTGVMVNDISECFKLTVEKENATTSDCCGIKFNAKYEEGGVSISLPINLCSTLSRDKTKREEEIKKIINQTSGIVSFDYYSCQSEKTDLKNLYLFIFIQLLFLI